MDGNRHGMETPLDIMQAGPTDLIGYTRRSNCRLMKSGLKVGWSSCFLGSSTCRPDRESPLSCIASLLTVFMAFLTTSEPSRPTPICAKSMLQGRHLNTRCRLQLEDMPHRELHRALAKLFFPSESPHALPSKPMESSVISPMRWNPMRPGILFAHTPQASPHPGPSSPGPYCNCKCVGNCELENAAEGLSAGWIMPAPELLGVPWL